MCGGLVRQVGYEVAGMGQRARGTGAEEQVQGSGVQCALVVGLAGDSNAVEAGAGWAGRGRKQGPGYSTLLRAVGPADSRMQQGNARLEQSLHACCARCKWMQCGVLGTLRYVLCNLDKCRLW